MDNRDYAIDVDVATRFLEDRSVPDNDQYVFAYTIQIRNRGALPARLIARHWVITDANGQVQEVRGEGVVGEQPWLRPGDAFEYTSGAVLATDQGIMHGEYEMLADDGTRFQAPVAPFALRMPRTLH